jgi:hypothetical protein
LGGLISKKDEKNENKVPWLGDLPGIGAAFRYRTYSNTKTELIIIMTPHIIRNRHDQERLLAEETRRVDWSLGDVLRVHGNANSMPCLPPVPGELQSHTQPFRITPGAPGGSDRPQMNPPVDYGPGQQFLPPTSKAPASKGGLLQAIAGRRAAQGGTESIVPLVSPGDTSVRYLPPAAPQSLPTLTPTGSGNAFAPNGNGMPSGR